MMSVITYQSYKDIPVYTVENQTDETVKTVHYNLLLPLPTVLDWMRPFDPDTLVKPVNDDNDANEVELDDDEDSNVDDSDGDSDSSGDEPICLCTRCQRKTPESPSDDDTNDDDKRSDVTIEELVAQEIERQTDSDSYNSADSGSDGEDGHVGTHSPPLAQRKSARERKLPAKYDGFIIGPLKQLSAILENKFLGQVYTEHYAQMCVQKVGNWKEHCIWSGIVDPDLGGNDILKDSKIQVVRWTC